MKSRIIKVSSVITPLLVFCGCTERTTAENQPAYFLLVGSHSEIFDDVEVGLAGSQADPTHKTGAVGATSGKDKPFVATIYYDKEVFFEIVDSGMQLPIKDDLNEITIESNSGVIYVYITKHYFSDKYPHGGIECVYKERITSESGAASATISFGSLSTGSGAHIQAELSTPFAALTSR